MKLSGSSSRRLTEEAGASSSTVLEGKTGGTAWEQVMGPVGDVEEATDGDGGKISSLGMVRIGS